MALNLLLLFMALCCFLVPQIWSVSFRPSAVISGRDPSVSVPRLKCLLSASREKTQVLGCPSGRAQPSLALTFLPHPSLLSTLVFCPQ